MGLFDKAKDLAGQHSDKVNDGIDRAGDMIDEKTDNKYADKVDQGQEAAKNFLNKDGNEAR